MVRGSGKFKTKRGGGRNFSRNLAPLDADGEPISVPDKWAPRGAQDDDDDDDDDEEDEDEDEDDALGVKPQPGPLAATPSDAPELTRAERRAQKKGKAPGKTGKAGDDDEEEEDDDDDLVNPNRAVQKNTKLANVGATPAPRELSRREREEKEKKEAKERYWKLHEQGKTDQAKADLARLAAIRKERELAAAQRKAEQEAKDAELKAKTAASKQKRAT